MRLRPLVSIALLAVLAACAAPGPERSSPGSEAAVAPESDRPAVAEQPQFLAYADPLPPVADLFPGASGDDLEPLAPPAEDLWDRIRKGYALPELEGPLVEKWEQWYVARPDYVARMVERSRRYLYYIVVEVEQRGLPLEIALLPMVESAFNPVAMSTSRAAGIWQFMPSTGKHYGLKQNFWFDSRRDVLAATESALAYLQKLYADFGDWQLALAAYNWGEGNVARAIAKNLSAGSTADYQSLRMPDETRNYLPKLQAVKNIVRDPEKYGLELGDVPDAPYFATVMTSRKIDVRRAAELAEMSIEEFRYLNPQHNRPVIAGADEHAILLPIDKAELFAAKLDLADQPLVSWQAHRMRPGETLPQVAARFGMTVETLRAVNGLGAKTKVHVGHTLLVPAQVPAEQAAQTLTNAVFTSVPQGRTFYYRVHRGDTLSSVAARYAVTTQDLRRWNALDRNTLKAGESLRITSDLAPNAGQAKRAAGRKASAPTAKTKATPARPAAKTNGSPPSAKAGASGSG